MIVYRACAESTSGDDDPGWTAVEAASPQEAAETWARQGPAVLAYALGVDVRVEDTESGGWVVYTVRHVPNPLAQSTDHDLRAARLVKFMRPRPSGMTGMSGPGGCIVSDSALMTCMLVLHFRIGNFRVSTIGGYIPPGRESYQMVSGTAYSDTHVYRVVDFAGCPEGSVPDSDWGAPLASAVAADSKNTREAERMHNLVACAVAICVGDGRTDDDSIVAAVGGVSDG